jgi:hypothetical protein
MLARSGVVGVLGAAPLFDDRLVVPNDIAGEYRYCTVSTCRDLGEVVINYSSLLLE